MIPDALGARHPKAEATRLDEDTELRPRRRSYDRQAGSMQPL